MSRTKIMGSLALVVLAVGAFRSYSAKAADEEAVKAALQHYLLGHSTGDGKHHAMVFHPESKLFWVQDGQLRTRTSAEYIAGASGKPAADEAQRKRRIVDVDVTETAAVAKIELDYPEVMFTDYFTLLKIDGKWQIVNKIFHRVPKTR